MPAVAPVVSVSVNLLLPLPGAAMLVGKKPAVTPFGRPLTDSATADLNPLMTAVVSVIFAGAPTATLALDALGASVKLGAGTTVRVNVAARVSAPPVPATVTVRAPATALAAAEIVALLLEVMGFRLNPAVTPLGKPDVVKLTLPVKPCNGVSVTVLVPLPP